MTLFRREPRSVYRVYAEDEYLDGGQPALELDTQEPPPELGAPQGLGGWSPGSLLVAGLIVAVAVAVFAIVFCTGHDVSRRPGATATAPALRHDSRVELYHARRSTPRRPRRRAGVHGQARPRPRRRRPPAAPRPATGVTSSALPVPDAQLEFGFER